jgi:hypothetical protein
MIPVHGYRGEPTPPPLELRPGGPTVAVSRQAGARGTSVAEAVGRRLGWQVVTQELLDFLADDDPEDLERELEPTARLWALAGWKALVAGRGLSEASPAAAVSRRLFALAARGRMVVVGRGAGFVLPAATTLSARLVAPEADRVSYLGDRLRLTAAEAAAEAAARDRGRAAFLAALCDRDIADPTGYDLTVNVARLGLDGTADVVAAAARRKFP